MSKIQVQFDLVAPLGEYFPITWVDFAETFESAFHQADQLIALFRCFGLEVRPNTFARGVRGGSYIYMKNCRLYASHPEQQQSLNNFMQKHAILPFTFGLESLT